jgi:hypothetical protein
MALQDTGGASGSHTVHQLETPESSVHRVPMPWTKMSNDNYLPITPELDSLVSSVVKGSEENVGKASIL